EGAELPEPIPALDDPFRAVWLRRIRTPNRQICRPPNPIERQRYATVGHGIWFDARIQRPKRDATSVGRSIRPRRQLAGAPGHGCLELTGRIHRVHQAPLDGTPAFHTFGEGTEDVGE